jgi:hypothetical protein
VQAIVSNLKKGKSKATPKAHGKRGSIASQNRFGTLNFEVKELINEQAQEETKEGKFQDGLIFENNLGDR